MNLRRSTRLLIALLLAFVLPLQAQQASETEAAQRQARDASERAALALLNDVLTEAQTLKLLENRLFVKVNAVEVLWTHDEKRARAVLQDATGDLLLLANEVTAAVNKNKNSHLPNLYSHLRSELVRIVARHDPEAALQFLQSTRVGQPPAPGTPEYDSERQLEINLAYQAAEADPRRALQLAERTLEKGLSYELINLLAKLREKNAEVAAKLIDAALAKLSSTDLLADTQASYFAFELLRRESHQANTATPPRRTPPLLDKPSLERLLETVTRSALNVSVANLSARPEEYEKAKSFFWSLRMALPNIDRHAPKSSEMLRAKIAEFNRTLTDRIDRENTLRADFYELLAKNEIDRALEFVTNLPAGSRDMLYYSAVGKVLEGGDHERARQIVEKMQDADWRNRTLPYIELSAATRTADADNLKQVLANLQRIEPSWQRASTLVQLATKVIDQGNAKLARRLLDEASQLVTGTPQSTDELKAQLEVASLYARIAPDEGFRIVAPLVEQMNEVVAATMVLDRFEYRMFVRDGEFILGQRYTFVGGAYAQCVSTLARLGREDLPQAETLANSFARPETRIYARLLLARTILNESNNEP